MVKNQKACFLNRKERQGEQYVNFLTHYTYDILNELNTYGAVLVYFYLCSLKPHTYDGKKKGNETLTYDKPYELSPKALKQIYPDHDENTFRSGINRLIEVGILRQIQGDIYLFDDIPLKYRVKTYDEMKEIQQMSAQDIYKMAHKEQLVEESKKMEELPKKYDWQ